jgi:hypothetical protein
VVVQYLQHSHVVVVVLVHVASPEHVGLVEVGEIVVVLVEGAHFDKPVVVLVDAVRFDKPVVVVLLEVVAVTEERQEQEHLNWKAPRYFCSLGSTSLMLRREEVLNCPVYYEEASRTTLDRN